MQIARKFPLIDVYPKLKIMHKKSAQNEPSLMDERRSLLRNRGHVSEILSMN